jgi:ribose transport system ATP-binding protein
MSAGGHSASGESAPREMQPSFVLLATGISKTYPGAKALSEVDFDLRSGEIHALCGENGAGKSTLMKVLAGNIRADEGTIRLKGEVVQFQNPLDAIRKGILLIHQEISLVPQLTVAENIFLGSLPVRAGGRIDRKALHEKATKTLRDCGYDISSSDIVGTLPIAKQQMVEIARAMAFECSVIIFDEPTASLTESESIALFANIRHLKEKNVGIVYVTHRMTEIFSISDRITVLRDGKSRGTVATRSTSENEIVHLMIGRTLDGYFHREARNPGAEVIRIDGLSVRGFVKNASFSVRSGEIVGLYGLVGSGRSELAEAIFGLRPKTAGTISWMGRPQTMRSAREAVDLGIGLVPEDRKRKGLVLGLGARDNVSLSLLRKLNFFGFSQKWKENSIFEEYKDRLKIKVSGPTAAVGTLSGGNQQKVVLAKWLATNPKFIILDEPTRGIDVGAKAEVHGIIARLASSGMAILLISSEMPEIIGVSHRIITMYQGVLKGEFDADDVTESDLVQSVMGLSEATTPREGRGQ